MSAQLVMAASMMMAIQIIMGMGWYSCVCTLWGKWGAKD